jgi:hypothetical protein
MAERKISHRVSFSALAPPVIVESNKNGENRYQISEAEPEREPETTEMSESSAAENENSHGSNYVSRYAKTLSQLTEALPRFEHFRNQDSLGGERRPGIDELHQGWTDKKVRTFSSYLSE